MATLVTVRFPSAETHFMSVETLPLEGTKLHVAGHDWIVTRVEEAWGEYTVTVLLAEPTPEQCEMMQREIIGDVPAVS
jgi:hypothetical protein